MKSFAAIFLLVPTLAFASNDRDIKIFEAVSDKLMTEDVQTVVVEDVNPRGSCLPDGASFMVQMQVRQIVWDDILEKNVNQWITVKSVNVNRYTGEVIQNCKR
ncbi:hypothetical protein [Bdellovibrio sp. KM01]|uniref:hypothetical protein n=1 Tax=Bdellovibrio sp. KM01 TaxID=2748865 RepID=UPI0015E92CB7|nr:hypothetical protein [Bdellovibrio sp. KM01]QLY23984.1 hypothetical protein HW988_10890 [Bdellovibrio sp. KM01]